MGIDSVDSLSDSPGKCLAGAWVAAAAMASHMLRRATGSIPAEGSSRNAATPEGGIHGHGGGGCPEPTWCGFGVRAGLQG